MGHSWIGGGVTLEGIVGKVRNSVGVNNHIFGKEVCADAYRVGCGNELQRGAWLFLGNSKHRGNGSDGTCNLLVIAIM